jgi:hypothetical protein
MWKVYVGSATITTKAFALGNGQFWCFPFLSFFFFFGGGGGGGQGGG